MKRTSDGIAKLAEEGGAFETRLVVDDKAVGTIIGRAGANIARLREESGTFISILKNDNVPKAAERVVTIKGDPANCAHAVALIRRLAVSEESDDNTPIEAKLLIPAAQAGSVIGKAGSVVQQIMRETGTNVSLSTTELPGSTEKSCTVTGTAGSVRQAVGQVLVRLQENPAQVAVTHYVPGGAAAAYDPAAAYPEASKRARPSPSPSPYYGAPPSPYGVPPSPYGVPPSPYGVPPSPYGAPPSPYSPYGVPPAVAKPQETTTETLNIPSASAGTVIGKSGSVIKQIKAQTALKVLSIGEADANEQRTVTITGTPAAIIEAIQLIRSRVEEGEAALQKKEGAAPPAPVEDTMEVPTAKAGSVIGRKGTVIQDIKTRSGCFVSIADPVEGSDKRVVSVKGTMVGVQLAKLLVRHALEVAEKK